jgi:hypothetical protein
MSRIPPPAIPIINNSINEFGLSCESCVIFGAIWPNFTFSSRLANGLNGVVNNNDEIRQESDMAGSLNKVMLIGNLGRDPEVRSFQNGGKVCNLRIATSERWRDKSTGENREKTEWTCNDPALP